jgi:hypothetical protein
MELVTTFEEGLLSSLILMFKSNPPAKQPVQKRDEALFASHGAKGSSVNLRYIDLDTGASLRVVTYNPPVKSCYPPVVFVPGLVSVIETFSGVIRSLTEKFTVHYVETREKDSSRLPSTARFGMKDIASDLVSVVAVLGMKEGEYILSAYSLSATAAAESFAQGLSIKPALLVLAEASSTFRMPWFGSFAAHYLWWSFPVIRPLLRFYIGHFMVDRKRDNEMYMISVRALNSANGWKLSRTMLALSDYELKAALSDVDVPTLVIGVSEDTFHKLNDSQEIATAIKDCMYIDLETNKRSHSPEVCDLICNHPAVYAEAVICQAGSEERLAHSPSYK